MSDPSNRRARHAVFTTLGLNFTKHREIVMKTRNTNSVSFRPMSPCLRLFIQSLLAEHGAEITIDECPDDDAIVGSDAFASRAPLAADKNYN
jgi:hypothetical protein